MADACVFLLENYSGEQHVNIGTGKEVTIRQLAQIVKETVGFEGEIVWNQDMPDGTPRKLTNVDKLHGLGWTHKVELEEGVKLAYEWFKENVDSARL
ncbi:MAG: GDP-L-fucose synthase, partial [Lachnospiraceae bacterium]|nr:GDP-L-fucose synthase [Lachnospiraceae bacterium]